MAGRFRVAHGAASVLEIKPTVNQKIRSQRHRSCANVRHSTLCAWLVISSGERAWRVKGEGCPACMQRVMAARSYTWPAPGKRP